MVERDICNLKFFGNLSSSYFVLIEKYVSTGYGESHF